MEERVMKRGLVIVDVQKDYFPGGNKELVGMEQASANAGSLLSRFREEEFPIIHVQHISVRPGGTFFLPETKGAEIHESVAPQPGEIVIQKHFPNSFRDTALLEILRERQLEEIVLCGAMSHMCIDSTTRAAADFGFLCVLIEDACATCDLRYKGITVEASKVHAAFMAALAAGYARVMSANEYSGYAHLLRG
jgi:nicotinamidase-related amidase